MPLLLSVRRFALLLVFALGACTGGGSRLQKDVIYIGNGAEPKDLDPHITTGVTENRIQIQLFEPLVSIHPETLEPVPGDAESWKVSKDGRTYTFKLRKDAKWSNGEPVTAHDYVYSWTRLLKPETAAEYAYQGYYFVNGKEFNTGKTKDASTLGFKALDDHTLEVKLVSPTPFFLNLLFHHSLFPGHRATIEKHGMQWTRPANIVTNGAFMVTKWETNKTVSMKPNPHYWDRARITLKEAHFLPIENYDTEEKLFRSNKINVTYEIPLEKIPTWEKDTTGVYQTAPYLGTYFYWINTQRKPLDDVRVRKALNLAIDRQQIVTHVTLGHQLPGTMYTPPGTGGYEPPSKLPKDLSRLEEAKQLLTAAGYPGGKGMPSIEILYNTHEGHKKIAEALQQMWKKNLGVNVTLFNQEWKVYLDTLHQMQFGLGRQGWIADYNDPTTFLDLLVSDNGNNRSGWKNAKFDLLIAQAGKELDRKKRLDYFRQAEDILVEELPVIPIYIYNRHYLKSTNVQGWFANVEDHHLLKFVTVK